MRIRRLNASGARRLISPTQAIASCRDAFAKLTLGQVELPDVLTIEVKEQRGEVHAKGEYLHGAPRFSIKIATGFYNNPAHGLPTSIEALVRASDLIVTTTPADRPIVRNEWVQPGTHITAMGSDIPHKQELEAALLGRAKVVVDRLSQCLTQREWGDGSRRDGDCNGQGTARGTARPAPASAA